MENTRAYEFHISYSHAEWYLLSSRSEIVLDLAEASRIKKLIKLNLFLSKNC